MSFLHASLCIRSLIRFSNSPDFEIGFIDLQEEVNDFLLLSKENIVGYLDLELFSV